MKKITLTILLIFLATSFGFSQKTTTETSVWNEKTFSGMEFRSVGPAFMAGRLSDIAIDPKNENVWYAAISSGGLWKPQMPERHGSL